MALDDFGIPNIDTTSGLYDPERQFEMRSARLAELAEYGAFTGDITEEVTSLATFAVSALRAGMDMCLRDGIDPAQFITTTGTTLLNDAIWAALANPDIRRSIHQAEVRQEVRQSKNNDGGMSRTLSVRPAPSNVPTMRPAVRNHG